MRYPVAEKEDTVLDFHSTKVAYPYKWMENPNDIRTKNWTIEQNELTNSYLKKIGTKGKYLNYLTKIWDHPKMGIPIQVNGKFYFMYNNGLQNQSVLHVSESLNDEKKVVLDPNLLSDDGTVALKSTKFSKDGKFMAYALSEKGSDMEIIKVKDLEIGEDTKDHLDFCRLSSISWRKNCKSFYYTRYEARDSEHNEIQFNKVYLHIIGEDQIKDNVVYENKQNKDERFSCQVSYDKEYLIVYALKGCGETNNLHIKKEDKNQFTTLYENNGAYQEVLGNDGPIFYILTNNNASKNKIISLNVETMEEKIVIPESESLLNRAVLIQDKFVIVYQNHAQDKVFLFSKEGKKEREIYLEGISTILAMRGTRKDTQLFFGQTSFTKPATIHYYDFEKNKLVTHFTPKFPVSIDGVTCKQEFVESKDGTKVPVFIISKGDPKGKPTLLVGYGGFNISMMPYFSTFYFTFIQHGGTVVSSCLRGGGEYGTLWHKAGMRENKQNVFDDFISVAEHLKKKYCTKDQLAIMGGSNGGLLVAACVLQKPDLCGSVSCHVPVADMLRFHKFTGGKYWVPEYGNADVKEDFYFLYKYSPIHNVKPANYPAMYITSADKDDRVVSSHAKQFTALLQKNQQAEEPILLRVETKAGHGQGKPTKMKINEAAEELSFLFENLG
jgi:prolyl oligopeptidase